MSPAVNKLEQEIQKLPLNEMVELHERLSSSIYAAEEELGLSPKWEQELSRRRQDVEAGRVTGVASVEAFNQIERELRAKATQP